MKQLYKLLFICSCLIILSSCTSKQHSNMIEKPKMVSDRDVIQFAEEAATNAYNYSHRNYQRRLANMSQYFTKTGFEAYQKAFLTSGNIDIIKSQKLTVSAVTEKKPILLHKGYVDLIYSWEVQVPLRVTYRNKTQLIQRDVIVNMTLVQVLANVNARGIAINRFITQSSGIIRIQAKN